jgi:antitoxin (DNA-binding transcriptional repressor) of toxin-antitoxin stability system
MGSDRRWFCFVQKEKPAMIQMTTSQVRQDFKNTMQKVARGERIVLSNHKKAVAAGDPIEDLELPLAIEDRVDAQAARNARAAADREGTTPWETIKADLEL